MKKGPIDKSIDLKKVPTIVLVLFLFYPLQIFATFTDITVSSGLTECKEDFSGFGIGASTVDYDKDGDLDVFLARPSGAKDRLYNNQGDGSFVDVASNVGLNLTEGSRSGVWFDYNSDKRLDLLISTDCFRTNCDLFGSLLPWKDPCTPYVGPLVI